MVHLEFVGRFGYREIVIGASPADCATADLKCRVD
jgi:hypothetical protein